MKAILKLILILNSINAYTIAEFNPKFFWDRPPESKFFESFISENSFFALPDFYSVNINMTDKTNEGLILMAIGDMDNDKHTDLVTVNSNQDCFVVHYWRSEEQQHVASP